MLRRLAAVGFRGGFGAAPQIGELVADSGEPLGQLGSVGAGPV